MKIEQNFNLLIKIFYLLYNKLLLINGMDIMYRTTKNFLKTQ